MTLREPTCRELVELITEYVEGALPPDDAAALEAHLAGCPACRRYLAQMRATIDALGHLPVEALSDEACETLLEAFRARQA